METLEIIIFVAITVIAWILLIADLVQTEIKKKKLKEKEEKERG